MKFRSLPLIPVVAMGAILLDQASKIWVLFGLRLDTVPGHNEFNVLPPYLVFKMAENYGMNFGLFADYGEWARWLMIAVALGISLWVWLWVRREKAGKASEIAAGLLIGGALGNVIDRLLYGHVVDFLNMSCCGIENPYSFNLADVGIFLGAVGLVLFSSGSGTTPTDHAKSGRKTP